MKQRLIGGFFVALTTLIIFLAGGAVSAVILTLISLAGIYELMKVYSLEKTSFAVVDYIATIVVYVLLLFDHASLLLPVIILVILLLLAGYVFLFPKYRDKDVINAFFSFFYITIMLSYVYQVRALESGLALSCFIIISSWGNDVFAYFTGSALGKHKFTPKVSPHKSVEGFIGGIIGAGLLGYLFAIVFKESIPFSGLYCAIMAAVAAFPAVIGDLAASAIKRNHEIKDYSNLIPGHGGIVDRVDSVLFTAPIIYYLVVLFDAL